MFENYLLISKITPQTLDQYWSTLVDLGELLHSFLGIFRHQNESLSEKTILWHLSPNGPTFFYHLFKQPTLKTYIVLPQQLRIDKASFKLYLSFFKRSPEKADLQGLDVGAEVVNLSENRARGQDLRALGQNS